jgi:hypothetical protein
MPSSNSESNTCNEHTYLFPDSNAYFIANSGPNNDSYCISDRISHIDANINANRGAYKPRAHQFSDARSHTKSYSEELCDTISYSYANESNKKTN